jgi:hypothetical protein
MARAKKPAVTDRWMEVARQRGMTGQPAAAKKSGRKLWRLLEDRLAPVRLAAAFALAQVRDPALVQAFIAALDGGDARRMAKGAILLGEAGFLNAAPYFAAGVTRENKTLSAALVRGLGLLADRASVPLLIDALEKNFVPTEAAEALGRIGDTRAAPALVRALGHKKEPVRAAAAYALGCLGMVERRQEAAIHKGLARLDRDRSDRVKLCAAVARFERGDNKALADIRSALD